MGWKGDMRTFHVIRRDEATLRALACGALTGDDMTQQCHMYAVGNYLKPG